MPPLFAGHRGSFLYQMEVNYRIFLTLWKVFVKFGLEDSLFKYLRQSWILLCNNWLELSDRTIIMMIRKEQYIDCSYIILGPASFVPFFFITSQFVRSHQWSWTLTTGNNIPVPKMQSYYGNRKWPSLRPRGLGGLWSNQVPTNLSTSVVKSRSFKWFLSFSIHFWITCLESFEMVFYIYLHV